MTPGKLGLNYSQAFMFFLFDLFRSILFFVNWILLRFFHMSYKIFYIMFINIVPPGVVDGLYSVVSDSQYRCRFVRKFLHCFGLLRPRRKIGLSYSLGLWDVIFHPTLLLSMLTHFFWSSSLSLSYFILAVPIRKCLGKHLCMSSPFPIAILDGTCFFRQCNFTCT